MNRLLSTALLACLFFSCNNDDCTIEESVLATGEKRLDTNINSPYHGQAVLDVYYSWTAEVESGELCKRTKCLSMESMQVTNISLKDIDLTLTLAGRGDFTFFIPKGNSISISPLPDFCANDSWGNVKEIVYR